MKTFAFLLLALTFGQAASAAELVQTATACKPVTQAAGATLLPDVFSYSVPKRCHYCFKYADPWPCVQFCVAN
jgi:hypothetical protein